MSNPFYHLFKGSYYTVLELSKMLDQTKTKTAYRIRAIKKEKLDIDKVLDDQSFWDKRASSNGAYFTYDDKIIEHGETMISCNEAAVIKNVLPITIRRWFLVNPKTVMDKVKQTPKMKNVKIDETSKVEIHLANVKKLSIKDSWLGGYR